MKKFFTILLLALTFSLSAQELVINNGQTVTIDDTQSYNNVQIRNHGTLIVNGTLNVSGTILVMNHATLQTNGTVTTHILKMKNHSTVNSVSGCTSYNTIEYLGNSNNVTLNGNVSDTPCGSTLSTESFELPPLSQVDKNLPYELYTIDGKLLSQGRFGDVTFPSGVVLILRVKGYQAKKLVK